MKNILANHTMIQVDETYNSVDLFEENEFSREGFESVSSLIVSDSACFLI